MMIKKTMLIVCVGLLHLFASCGDYKDLPNGNDLSNDSGDTLGNATNGSEFASDSDDTEPDREDLPLADTADAYNIVSDHLLDLDEDVSFSEIEELVGYRAPYNSEFSDLSVEMFFYLHRMVFKDKDGELVGIGYDAKVLIYGDVAEDRFVAVFQHEGENIKVAYGRYLTWR